MAQPKVSIDDSHEETPDLQISNPSSPTRIRTYDDSDLEDEKNFLRPRKSYFGYEPKKFFLSLTALIIFIILALFYVLRVRMEVTTLLTNQYMLPESFSQTPTDLTTVKGTHTEAYGLLLCTDPGVDEEQQVIYLNALKVMIFRLIKMQAEATNNTPKRDIVVLACTFTPFWQLEVVQRTGVILNMVESLTPPRTLDFQRWKHNFTKFQFWRLVLWDRVLFMDVDILFLEERNFFDIWEHPATQVRYNPPENVDPNTLYFGWPIKMLYPYVIALGYDTFCRKCSYSDRGPNSGVFITKPNIVHYELMKKIAFDVSIPFKIMEQTALDYIFNISGPLPWTEFEDTYNWTPEYNPLLDSVKGYHVKGWLKEKPVWMESDPKTWGNLPSLWQSYYTQMEEANRLNISILPESPTTIIGSKYVSVTKLQLSSDQGVLYYLAASDLNYYPTHTQLIENSGQPIKISSNANAEFTLVDLNTNTEYRIFYTVKTSALYAPLTNIYYINIHTKSL
jgi:alpha-N-acetylglucosamine transferase